ncbi:MAG TPA: hypothetical protein VLV78_18730 [Thermoanaerobaculia bacterium]|nr:hypothetical protein [Thermoanaerobaculia bacterium]
MHRVSLVLCLLLLPALPLAAQDPKLDVATPQPPAVLIGNGADAQQVMRIVGGKGGNSPDTSAHPGAGSSVLIQAGNGGDGSGGMGSSGAGGSIILLPGAPGSFGDINGAAGGVGIGTSTPQKMLSVRDGMNIDQADANNGTSLYPGLSFGSNSGSGIASARSGFNPMGLDLYTGFTKRISISSTGAVTVVGTLSKGGGSFKIDHPLDPQNKYLSHSFVESPDMKNIYDGVVRLDANGEATVDLPDWFEALNEDFRYQLTAIGKPSPGIYVAEEVHDHQFRISGGSAGAKVSWQVTGIRHDAFANAHRIVVEEEKSGVERGTLLYPREDQMNAERMGQSAAMP